MKRILVTAILCCGCIMGFAQQKQNKSEKVKINPPVQKSSDTINKAVVRFKPPIIVKDAPTKKATTKSKKPVKFTPPVIVKDKS